MKFRFTKKKAQDIGEQLSEYLNGSGGSGLTPAEKAKLDSIEYASSTVDIKNSVGIVFSMLIGDIGIGEFDR